MQAIVYPGKIAGTQEAPASKSSMQRACAAALLHIGDTLILNPGHANDDLAALEVIQMLGARIIAQSETFIKVESAGVHPKAPFMHCGESGLGIRMFTPIAAMSSNEITIHGEGSLLKRPMHFFDEILPSLGVEVQSNKGYLPIQIKGPLKTANITVDGSMSSQFLTGILMAFAALDAYDKSIKVINLKSKPYIDLTLSVLTAFGWKVEHQAYETFSFLPHPPIKKSIEYTVEGDWSGAAFLLVAGALAGPIKVKGLQLDSTQADKAIIHALERAKAQIIFAQDGIIIGPNIAEEPLQAFHFDATDCPDLFPPLVALAAVAVGTTTLLGVHRLAHKESNRGISLQAEFYKMGVSIELEGDLMKIHGGQAIQSATIYSHQDHRIAMASSIAALKANGPITITAAEAINKSYTNFFEHLQQLGVKVDLL